MALFQPAPSVIAGVKFGLLSPDAIRKLSVVDVRTPDTYDEDGMAIKNGLMDGRLGALEPGQRCETCGNTAANCLGHFGHIELAIPVVHVGFVSDIYTLLSSTCRSCGRILMSDKAVEEVNKAIEEQRRLLGEVPGEFYSEVIKKVRKKRVCMHCETEQHDVKFNKPTEFWEVTEAGPKRLTASMIRERLERILDSDLRLLGFDPEVMRPEWAILTVLPVPPLCVRPSITLESGLRSEDDLTHKLVDILRINQRLKESIDMGAPTLIIEDLSELLQYHITTYFDNETSGIPPARHRSGRMLKTIAQRLKGKEGRFRGNLSGKRVDFSARAVISPDPNLDIDEVGVPLEVAKRLTIPEKVTAWNIEEMRELVRNGPETYPGSLYVIRPDGRRIRLEYVADRESLADSLEEGFIVERQLKDGDIAVFNRQPSLHRMSIMAHRVWVLPYNTLRLHLSVCPPYNADFDGDEMNLHIPQSDEARAEAKLLMMVQDQILSPRYGAPIIGATRDYITAIYLLTRGETRLTKPEVCRLLLAAGFDGKIPRPAIKRPKPLWTGKQIFSLFLPKDFNYVGRSSVCISHRECKLDRCPLDAYVVVVNGELRRGVIDKNSIGAERAEGIYHRLVKDYGTDFGRSFLNSICRLLNEFIVMRGFSFSLSELDLDRAVESKIRRILSKHRKRVQDLVEDYKVGRLEKLPGKELEESLEIYVMNELAKARDASGKIAYESLGMDNSGTIMIRTGARGTAMNITQMTSCIGQQSIRGGRILRGYRGRSLSHFRTGDPRPEARGFIASSYRSGLNPIEFFFHAVGGREGLVDTAVRTQQSGYMQRRLVNALEHLHVDYDGTLRSSDGDIVQFVYGEDGVDPAKSDHGKAVNVQKVIEMVKFVDKGRPAPATFIRESVGKVRERLTPSLSKVLERRLLGSGLSRSGIRKAIRKVVESYRGSLIEPGEAVGIVAAQSIGEPGTQMTLRTFHYAGVRERNVTLGLPRIIEIVDARKEPSTPVMTIHLDREHRGSKEKAEEIARMITPTTLGEVASISVDLGRGLVDVKVDRKSLAETHMSLGEVRDALSSMDCEVEKAGAYRLLLKFPSKIALEKVGSKLYQMKVKGVPNISRAIVAFEGNEWVVYTDGSNLVEILRVEGVDPTRIYTNNIEEIGQVLGIEAARNAIIRELQSVLEEQGLDVDIRHIMLVADAMTAKGAVEQIGRHGLSGRKESILAKAAFEITVPTITEAALKGKVDPLKGVTENVIVGQSIPIGTGMVDLYMRSGR